MFPKSSAWQILREEALRIIPSPTKLYFKSAVPLRNWRLRGSYVVTSCDKNKIVLRASPAEFASVLISDVELLLDHAAEQRASLKMATGDDQWFSPAWTVVTAYYWSFFSALSLTRMVGRSTWHLDKVAIRDLSVLANTLTGRPGAGTLYFEVKLQPTGDCEMLLQPSGRNSHEAVWFCYHQLVKRIFAATDQNASVNEYRLWWCLTECAKILGDAWPSDVRNDVNYKIGLAYLEVTKTQNTKAGPQLRKLSEMDLDALLGQFETEVHRIQSDLGTRQDLETLTKLLILNSLALALIAENLHKDILDRVDGDKRWLQMRQKFFSEKCPSESNKFWPFGGLD